VACNIAPEIDIGIRKQKKLMQWKQE